MTRLSISRAWDQTKTIVAREVHLISSLVLALIVLPVVVLSQVGAPVASTTPAISQVVYILSVVLGLVAHIALARLAVPPSVRLADSIKVGLFRVLSVLLVLVVVLIGLVIAATAIALSLRAAGVMTLPVAGQPPSPGLLVLLLLLLTLPMAIVQLVFPVAAVETGNPVRLFARTWQLARGNYLRLLGFFVIMLIALLIVGMVCQFGVGSIIALLVGRPIPGSLAALLVGLISGTAQAAFTTVLAVMLARIYAQLAGGDAEVGVPITGI